MNSRSRILLAVCLALMVAAAQEGGPSGGSASAAASSALGIMASPISTLVGVESPIISDKYVLMPGDKLLVTVKGGVTYSYQTWITYEGKVTVNLPQIDIVDAITVSGLTLAAAQDTMTHEMLKYFKNVTVQLTLTGLRSGIVFLTGEVQYPGAYNASPVERVSQVISRAGGLSPLGSKTHIRLIRNGKIQSMVDIERFEASGDLLANPFVESGDVLQVPAVEGLVTVKGAIFGRGEYRLRTSALTTDKERISEGIYELKPGERVSDMISKAGGITPWADLYNSYVERLVVDGAGTRRKIPVDLRRVLFEQDPTADIEMMNADYLVVPPINTLIYVEGEVTKPGSFLFTPNLKVSDYVGQGGGPTSYANFGSTYIIRQGKKLSARSNPVVEAGDIVMIPRVGLKWWQDYITILSAVGVPVASILVTIALSRASSSQ